MNKSFNAEESSYYLPPINKNDTSALNNKGRSQSLNEIHPVGSLTAMPVQKKLVASQNLKGIEEYDEMNEKQLLREHQQLLKILKKYQQLIDISLTKKQKQKEKEALHKAKHGEKKFSREQLLANEANNNKKIIANYLREIKDLQSAQKHRKLHEVLDEKSQVNDLISRIKKQIFQLKNEDTMASRNLMTDRGQIQKQLNEAEKDLKIQLTKNAEYKKKKQDLMEQLQQLKKQCQSINIQQLNLQSHQKDYMQMLAEKKFQLEQAQRNYGKVEDTIQEVMIAKTKRNKVITKDIETMEKRIIELNNKIHSHKQKVQRYQKVIEPTK